MAEDTIDAVQKAIGEPVSSCLTKQHEVAVGKTSQMPTGNSSGMDFRSRNLQPSTLRRNSGQKRNEF